MVIIESNSRFLMISTLKWMTEYTNTFINSRTMCTSNEFWYIATIINDSQAKINTNNPSEISALTWRGRSLWGGFRSVTRWGSYYSSCTQPLHSRCGSQWGARPVACGWTDWCCSYKNQTKRKSYADGCPSSSCCPILLTGLCPPENVLACLPSPSPSSY